MPIHDWKKVPAGIFHDFHNDWIQQIKHALNDGILPPDYYALSEQAGGGKAPDVLALQAPSGDGGSEGGTATLVKPTRPKTRFHSRLEVGEEALYAAKAKSLAIRHVSGHRVVAMIEIVSSANKSSSDRLERFIEKVGLYLRNGVHVLIVDLIPPGPLDRDGLHALIWGEKSFADFRPTCDEALACLSYVAGDEGEAFIEPLAVGSAIPDMPVFLTPDYYVDAPLERTYAEAFEGLPAFWRGKVSGN